MKDNCVVGCIWLAFCKVHVKHDSMHVKACMHVNDSFGLLVDRKNQTSMSSRAAPMLEAMHVMDLTHMYPKAYALEVCQPNA
jgi:hypothetical protein